MTIYEVKQKAVDALGEVDVSKLNIGEIYSYVQSLKFLDEIKEPDTTYSDAMKSLTEKMVSLGNYPAPKTLDEYR